LVKVKICGITNEEDALEAVKCGADFLGFVFVKGTPRFRDKNVVKQIVSNGLKEINPDVVCVGLFINEDLELVAENVNCCGLNCVQLHGDESPAYCNELKTLLLEKFDMSLAIIKSFKVDSEILPNGGYTTSDYNGVDYFVFDTFHPEIAGGTGSKFDLEVLEKETIAIKKPFFVAGGLNPRNVSYVIEKVSPYGVDVSTGVESILGKKDKNLLKEFIYNAKNV